MKNTRLEISLEREEISDVERELFLSDIRKVAEEYFEFNDSPSLEITRSDDGFIVCLLFTARRVKSIKKVI